MSVEISRLQRPGVASLLACILRAFLNGRAESTQRSFTNTMSRVKDNGILWNHFDVLFTFNTYWQQKFYQILWSLSYWLSKYGLWARGNLALSLGSPGARVRLFTGRCCAFFCNTTEGKTDTKPTENSAKQ